MHPFAVGVSNCGIPFSMNNGIGMLECESLSVNPIKEGQPSKQVCL